MTIRSAIVLLAATTPLCAQDLAVTAVPVGSGPLLTVIRTEGNTRIVSLLEPDAETPDLRPFARRDHNLTVHGRLDRSRLLIEQHGSGGGLSVVDLAAGKAHPLLESRNRTRLLELGARQILVAEEFEAEVVGYRLEPKGDSARVLSAPTTRFQILAVDPTGARPARPLLGDRTEAVLAITPTDLWLLVHAEERELWKVPRGDGKPHRVGAVAGDVLGQLTTAEPSPDGTRIALGIAHADDFFVTRELVVLDVASGRHCFPPQTITVVVSTLSSSSPRLEMTWVDAGRLRFSESDRSSAATSRNAEGCFRWVDVDVATGKRLAEVEYGPVLLSHRRPERDTTKLPKPTPRWPEGAFDRTAAALHFRGEAAPILDAAGADVAVEGRYAALTVRKPEEALYLADAETRQVRRVAAGFYWSIVWLPAVSPGRAR